jgi:hypothetical protein
MVQRGGTKEEMANFVKSAGGSVPFFDFSKELLMNRGYGFLEGNIPVPTPMNCCPAYRVSCAALVLGVASKVATARDKSDVRMVDIGLGGVEFCKDLQKCLGDAGEFLQQAKSPLRTISYTAVDPNEKLIETLRKSGVNGIIGEAQQIPLNEGQADVVIAGKLLNALPYDLYEVKRDGRGGQKIEEKAFVQLSEPRRGKDLKLVFKPIDRDALIKDLEEHVGKIPHYEQNGQGRKKAFYAYSPDYLEVWRDMHRILAQGGMAIVSDYTPMYRPLLAGEHRQEQEAVKDPYRSNLIHPVDADLQAAMAEAAGFGNVNAFSVEQTAHLLANRLADKEAGISVCATVLFHELRLIVGERSGNNEVIG